MVSNIAKAPLDMDTVLKAVGLEAKKRSFPRELSGGEQQRVAIATYAGDFLFMPLAQFNSEFGLPTDAYIGIWSDQPMTFAQGEIRSTKSIDAIITGFGTLLDQMGPMI